MRARTGATNGRVGGRLSAGSRASKALAAAPKVKVVGVAANSTPQSPAEPSNQAFDQLNAAAHAAQMMAARLGLSPGSAAPR